MKKKPKKLNIQKTKITASGAITSWQIDAEKVETVTDFIFLGFKITADGDCSHKIKRHPLLWRKTMKNLDSVFKSRDINLLTKVHIVQAVVFPVVMCRCELDLKEGWAPKNWYFWTAVLEKTLKSPLDSKGIKPVNPKVNQPWIFIGRTDAVAETPVIGHLATWCSELTHWKRPWCWERLRARGEAGNKGWDGWMASLSQWTWVWANSGR